MNKINVFKISMILMVAAAIEIYTVRQPIDLFLTFSIQSAGNTSVQLFYDYGEGFFEEHSKHYFVNRPDSFVPIRFSLPRKPKIQRLRLDPADADLIVQLSDMKIVDRSERIIRKIDPEALKVIHGIERIATQNGVAIIEPDDSKDPQLKIDIPYPIKAKDRFNPIRFGTVIISGVLILFLSWPSVCKKGLHWIKQGFGFNEPTNLNYNVLFFLGIIVLMTVFFWKDDWGSNGVHRNHLPGNDVSVFDHQGDDRQVSFHRSDGLRIVGSLYGMNTISANKKPGFILFHGNLMIGRKIPIIQVLAESLERIGYIVLTIDFTGFGKSDDPFRLGTLEAIDINQDAHAALSYFLSFEQVDKERIFLLGHSMGAGPAIKVGIERPEVKAIVAMGPPRRVTEIYMDSKGSKFFWDLANQYRSILYKTDFPEWYTKSVWAKRVIAEDMIQFIPYFQSKGHKALLLMQEEKVTPEDEKFLQNFYDQISYPKDILTTRGVNHFWNTDYKNGRLFYSPQAMHETITDIDQWVKRSGSRTKILCDRLRNIPRPRF